MKISHIDHFSIATPDLEATRAFYCDVLGMEVGPRPAALTSTGYWFYCGEKALIHVVEQKDKTVEPPPVTLAGSGVNDHIALTVGDSAGLVDEIKARGLAYWDRLLADRGLYQVFVRDPNGVIIELNDYAPEIDRLDPMTVQGAS